MITSERLETILRNFSRLTIGLVGDLFLDCYLEIEPGVEEYSIETGLEAFQIGSVRNYPGALGTVLNNLAALGVGSLVPVTVIGDDGQGDDLLRQMKTLPVDTTHIFRRSDRLTPTYTKPLRQNAYGKWTELNRLDIRTRGPLAEEVIVQLCDRISDVFHRTDGLIVMDQTPEQDWGVISNRVRATLEQLSRQDPKKVVLIDSRTQLRRFGFGILKGNRTEILGAANHSASSPAGTIQQAAALLARKTGQPVYCTLGDEGILLICSDGQTAMVPACPLSEPIDIVGAGDSVSSGIIASLLSGANEVESAMVGNLVASITVQQLGTTGTASPEQVLARLQETQT